MDASDLTGYVKDPIRLGCRRPHGTHGTNQRHLSVPAQSVWSSGQVARDPKAALVLAMRTEQELVQGRCQVLALPSTLRETRPMLRVLLIIIGLAQLAMAAAQTLVSTGPQTRTALLEEFTAIRCGNCPSAHVVANALSLAHPDDLVVVGVHGGGLAVPIGAQPDFRTPDGTALWSQFSVAFQPQGLVNRGPLLATANWTNAVQNVLATPSPVNLGVATTFDAATRILTIDLESYYTTTSAPGTDAISVLLTQDRIVGYQQDYMNGAQAAYEHRHVLRDYLTPIAGDPVLDAEEGSLVQRTWTFAVPESWDAEDLSVVAFIGEQGGVVYQARSVGVNSGATAVRDEETAVFGTAYPVPATEVVTIPMNTSSAAQLTVRDMTGRIVRNVNVPASSEKIVVDVRSFAPGHYFYQADGGRAQRFVVGR
jgi:Outer membrane protein Omp28/Secretion system C-terminal sorting domain